MKIVETIKKRYFPHKVKLVKGEERTYLTELDKAFIYACGKLELLNNRRGWYHHKTEISWLSDYKPNKYDFFKFNVEVQMKCWDSGHLKEILGQMVINLDNPKYWKPFFKLMNIFSHKEYKLGFKIYNFVKEVALTSQRISIYRVLDYVLEENIFRTDMSWERVYTAFTRYFEVEEDNYQQYESQRTQTNQSDLRIKYLRILGISKEVSKSEIKTIYRKLVLQHHPDKGGNPERFRQIQEAYEYLIK